MKPQSLRSTIRRIAQRLPSNACRVLILSLLFSVSLSQAAEKIYRWKMQRYNGSEYKALYDAFNESVLARSNGRLRIKIFEGGELVPNTDLLRATAKGIIQLNYGYPSYWAGEFPLSKIEAGLPRAWTSIEEMNKLWNEYGFKDLLTKAYQEKGVVYLGKGMGGDYDLLSKEPVTSIADLQKMKIRASANMATVLNKLDIATVYLSGAEMYTGLSTGAIDGLVYGSAYDYEILKLNEVAKHYTRLSLIYPGFAVTVLANEKAWQELPDDLKTILQEEIDKLTQAHHELFVEGQKQTLAKNVFTYHELKQEDVDRFNAIAPELWEAEAKLSPDNRKAIDAIIKLAKDSGRL